MSAKAVADEKWNTEVQEIATAGLGKAGFLGLWGSKPRATQDEFEMGVKVGQQPVWRNVLYADHVTTDLPQCPDCDTLDKIFAKSCEQYPNNPCLGKRSITEVEVFGERKFEHFTLSDFEWLTYQEVKKKVDNFGAGLAALGMQKGKNISIYADTSDYWQMTSQACFARGFPVATVYASLGAEALEYGLAQTEVTHVVTDAALVPTIAQVVDKLDNLKYIIFTSDPRPAGQGGHKSDDEIAALITNKTEGVKAMSWDKVAEMGSDTVSQKYEGPNKEDNAVIMYTSGSTGNPKGVVLTHANIVAALGGMLRAVPNLNTSDVFIGYLPLAHILALSAENAILSVGACIGYGTPKTLTDKSPGINQKTTKGDAPTLAPTVMAAVPAIMDRIREGVMDAVAHQGSVTKKIFDRGYGVKQGNSFGSTFYDWLIFDGLRTKLLGGRLRMMLSGGGPLSEETQNFMNIAFCCPVGQGYGLTETCGAATIVWPNDGSYGRVGPPLSCCEVKLVPWEEAGYSPDDKPHPRGEILLGGAHIAKEYYMMPEKTAEDFRTEENGKRWFHTGDIGEVCADGVLKIIDRKKDLVKAAGGEYVSYGKIEPLLKDCPLVDNVVVYQDPSKAYCIALVTVAPKKDPPAPEEVVAAFAAIGKQKKLAKFEIPTKVHVCDEPWTPENGMTTAAMKVKRNDIVKKYKSEIQQIYT
jgi:long-chain acyl-CoA synthetase